MRGYATQLRSSRLLLQVPLCQLSLLHQPPPQQSLAFDLGVCVYPFGQLNHTADMLMFM